MNPLFAYILGALSPPAGYGATCLAANLWDRCRRQHGIWVRTAAEVLRPETFVAWRRRPISFVFHLRGRKRFVRLGTSGLEPYDWIVPVSAVNAQELGTVLAGTKPALTDHEIDNLSE